jgi:hypothetical protein
MVTFYLLVGSCDHSMSCPDTIQWVCANNGQSYMNECKMKKEGCRLGIKLTIDSFGECDDQGSGSGGKSIDLCCNFLVIVIDISYFLTYRTHKSNLS